MDKEILIDNKGKIFKSIREFCREYKCSRDMVSHQLKSKGIYKHPYKDISLHKEIKTNSSKNKNLLKKINERYSKEELQLISKGRGIGLTTGEIPKINLSGTHYRIGVISDGHLGSKYSPDEYHYKAFNEFEKQHCNFILHCGDVVEGWCPGRTETHVQELTHLGYSEQKQHAIEVFSKCKLPIYVISGNHDAWYMKMGGNIVKEICDAVPNMTYLGHDHADFPLDNITIKLFHGTDGSTNSYSARLQKFANIYATDKPDIFLAGHVHKMCYIMDNGIQCISVPALQTHTSWMESKKLVSNTGFLILDFETTSKGICNFQVKLYPLKNKLEAL